VCGQHHGWWRCDKKSRSPKEMRQAILQTAPSFHSALCFREVTSQIISRAFFVTLHREALTQETEKSKVAFLEEREESFSKEIFSRPHLLLHTCNNRRRLKLL
jgi:hypothetical protein